MGKDIPTEISFVAGADADRFLELCYWSEEEPGLLDIVRAVMGLSPAARTALQGFLNAKSAAVQELIVTAGSSELVMRHDAPAGPGKAASDGAEAES